MLLTHSVLRRLCLAREMLSNVEENAPSLREIARALEISSFQLIRHFEAAFGITPHQFRIAARIDRAKRLLALGEHSVTEVCMEVGFSSLGSFSSSFARRVGASPSAYRRHVRATVQVPWTLPRFLAPGCLSLMTLLPGDAFRNFGEASAVNVS
jgi:AraC-like DNA-binding protein